jgi:flagellar protein FliO/FliZ
MIDVIGQLLLVLLALAAVIGMIFGAAWLAKRYGAAGMLGATARMRTLAVTNVGQRERVVLLEVNGVQLLLGVSAGSVRTLREFPAGSFVADAVGSAGSVGATTGEVPAPAAGMPFKDALAIAVKRALGQTP